MCREIEGARKSGKSEATTVGFTIYNGFWVRADGEAQTDGIDKKEVLPVTNTSPLEPVAHISPAMRLCISDCNRCHGVCLSMAANHCLETGGRHVEPTHFRTMLDCAQICQTSADFMLRNSCLHALICRACAEVCSACARSCEEIGDMQACVDACRRCADSCRAMADATARA